MDLNQDIYDAIKNNNSMITTAQVLALGYSRTQLSRFVKQGLLKRNRHGIYVLPNDEFDDMYTLSLRSKKLIFSHETALFLNGLAKQPPALYCVTIPSNAALPASIVDECTCYYCKEQSHLLGCSKKKTAFGNEVQCYNAERTICDMLRRKSGLNNDKISTAIDLYMTFKDKDLNLLITYANVFGVSEELKKYINIDLREYAMQTNEE